MVHRVFVYGTLKQGFSNGHFLEDCLFLGNASIKGQLLDIGHFPGLVGSDDWKSRVWGEVYLVTHDILAQLDRLEGEGSLYLRKSVIVRMETNCKGKPYLGQKAKLVWAYFWGSHTDYAVIESGNWGMTPYRAIPI